MHDKCTICSSRQQHLPAAGLKGLKEALLRRRMQYQVCKIKRSNGNAGTSRLPPAISNYGAPLYEYVKSVRGAPANCLRIASNIDRALVNLFTVEIMYSGRAMRLDKLKSRFSPATEENEVLSFRGGKPMVAF